MNDVHHSKTVAETARLVRSVGSRSIMGTRKGERRRRSRQRKEEEEEGEKLETTSGC